MIIGIDEAGKGPVIGSMFVAAVEEVEEPYKDSKIYTRSRLMKLGADLVNKYKYRVIELTCTEIDAQNLNILLADTYVKLCKEMGAQKAYIDACWPNASKLAEYITSRVPIEVVCEHKADTKYNVVSAASIIAKYHREMHVDKLKEEIGDFGSGYPADAKTMEYIRNNLNVKYRRLKWQIKL